MKNRNRLAVIMCAVIVVFCFTIRRINLESSYNQAVSYLECGDYASALEIIEDLGDYRHTRQLKNYALALQHSDSDSYSSKTVAKSYISLISTGYSGELCNEIRELAKELKLKSAQKG